MIDLHLHTTASDGEHSASEVIARAAAAGIRTLSITDHDTMAAVPEACAVASGAGVEVLPGIELTAVWRGHDVHVLGYFLAAAPPGLEAFLVAQRRHRSERLRAMASRLAALGVPVSLEGVLAEREATGRALGRPHVAQALVRAGHVTSVQEAFDRFLGDGRAAWVARRGAPPARVIQAIADAGGVASLAHPGLNRDRRLIQRLARQGLEAVEVFHSRHDVATQQRLLETARSLGLSVTGGSDFHGAADHRAGHLGRIGLPPEHYQGLRERLARAAHRVELVQASRKG